jgi:hypothetical protein
MRRPTIVVIALTVAVVAVVGATVINANSLRPATPVPHSASIDVMQMMQDAQDLPEQRYDAH